MTQDYLRNQKMTFGIFGLNTQLNSTEYLPFWDKTDNNNTLVIATHGVIKKSNKVSKSGIEKTKQIRKEYFEYKDKK